MKLLTVLFLLGVAFASAVPLYSDDLDTELDEITEELDNEFIIYAEAFPFFDKLKEDFEKLVERMKKSFDEGKGINGDLMKKAEDFYNKLKNLGVEISDKVKQIFEDLKSKMGGNAPERVDFFNFRDILTKLKEKLENHEIDIEKMRESVEKFLGNSELTNQFLNMIKEKGDKARTKIIEIIDRILGNKSQQLAFPFFDKLKEDFERLVEKMKKAFDDGKGVNGDLMKKAQDFYDKLKNLGVEISDKVKQIFEDLKSKMGRNSVQHVGPIFERMRERIENLINKIKKNFDDGKGVNKDLMKKAQDVIDKFKNLGFELREKVKQVWEDLKSKMPQTRSVQNVDFNFLDMFKKLKQLIKDNVDADVLKAKVESMFGKGSEFAKQLIEKLKEHGGKHKESILDWIDRVLGEKEEEKRSIKEIFEKIKDYFRDINIELKEKFVKFGEYVKDKYHDAVDKTKSDIENVKNIAKKFVEDTSKLSKDLAEEAKEFFRDYKNDLGTVWDDVRNKVQNILKRKD